MGNSYNRKRRKLEHADPKNIPPVPNQYEIIPAKIYEVYDGDTLKALICVGEKVIKLRLRLKGLDTPEIRTKRDIEKEAGKCVREIVKNMIEGKTVPIKIEEWGKFGGRVIATVYMNDPRIRYDGTLQSFLLKNGLAKFYDGGKKEEWSDEELKAILKQKSLS